MSGFQKYVAIQDFSLNVAKKTGEMKTLEIKVGDDLDFDGIYVMKNDEELGTAAALRSVIGEWIEAYNGSDSFLKKIQEKVRGKAVKPQVLRQVIANSTIEHSSPDTDNDINRKPTPEKAEELKKIVNEPEKPEVVEDFVTDSNTKIVNDDQKEVMKVTQDGDAAEARSSSSVELSDAGEEKKLEVISDEDSIAKETSYDKAKDKFKNTKVSDAIEDKISIEEDAVIETDYADPERTDISSSTQAQVEEKPAVQKKTAKKAGKAKAKSNVQKTKNEEDLLASIEVDGGDILVSDQDGVVVKKGSKITLDKSVDTKGIESKLTLGASSDDDGVTFSSEGNTAVEITEDSAIVVSEIDDSIDVSSLLDNL